MASPHRPRAGSRAGRSGRPGAVRRGGSTRAMCLEGMPAHPAGPRWRKADHPRPWPCRLQPGDAAGARRVAGKGLGPVVIMRSIRSRRQATRARALRLHAARGGCGHRRPVARGHAAGSGADGLRPIVVRPCDRVDPLHEEGLRNGYRAPASFRDASGSLQQGCRGKGMMRPPVRARLKSASRGSPSRSRIAVVGVRHVNDVQDHPIALPRTHPRATRPGLTAIHGRARPRGSGVPVLRVG